MRRFGGEKSRESNSWVESAGEFRNGSLEALGTCTLAIQSVVVCSYSKSVVYGYHKTDIIKIGIKTLTYLLMSYELQYFERLFVLSLILR